LSNALAIETQALTKRYGRQTAVDALSLSVPSGSVFAFLGRNGAGKTTTIQILLDLLNRTSGEARVLGRDCVRQALDIRRHTGYVADGQRMYDWMKVDEIIWYCRGFYPAWDDGLAAELKAKLELPGEKKIGQMSRGMQAKLALLLAMAHRPELLILDEPTAGLDVVVRRDFLESVIDLIQQEGRTVFFSSHIVHEVERVADWVGIIDHGKMLCCLPLETLKENVRRIDLTFPSPPDNLRHAFPNVLTCRQAGKQVSVIVRDYTEDTLTAVQALRPATLKTEMLGLEDIFVALVGDAEEA
jgi:ABC-2 type transport system ATP-binding protein